MTHYLYPSVLSIAGFDGSGGAGIQADTKTISALGCYATNVLTALPVQNTTGVKKIYPIPIEAVRDQLDAILEDIPPRAIKIGMVHHHSLVELIAEKLQPFSQIPIVFDPVMVATSGHTLIEPDTIESFIRLLFPLARLITPNLDEASLLAGFPVKTVEDMYRAGEQILTLGCPAVLLKGGHLQSDTLTSLLFDGSATPHAFHSPRIDTRNTHGSGCTLSSAIASFLARGESLFDAVSHGIGYTDLAIASGGAVITGKGNGPLNHFFNPQPMIRYEMV